MFKSWVFANLKFEIENIYQFGIGKKIFIDLEFNHLYKQWDLIFDKFFFIKKGSKTSLIF